MRKRAFRHYSGSRLFSTLPGTWRRDVWRADQRIAIHSTRPKGSAERPIEKSDIIFGPFLLHSANLARKDSPLISGQERGGSPSHSLPLSPPSRSKLLSVRAVAESFQPLIRSVAYHPGSAWTPPQLPRSEVALECSTPGHGCLRPSWLASAPPERGRQSFVFEGKKQT